jgi:hypothetical protein
MAQGSDFFMESVQNHEQILGNLLYEVAMKKRFAEMGNLIIYPDLFSKIISTA